MSYSWTPADFQTLVAQASAVGIDPAEAALLFLEETGGSLSPAQPGPAGSNVGGLNQMLAGNVPGVSMAQWLAMTAAQQIPYIFAWWKKEIGAQPFPSTGGTLLALNFLPGQFQAVGADTNPSAILAGKSGPYATYYAQNASLDPNKTGAITPATCELRLDNVAAASAKWPGFLAQIRSYQGAGAPAVATAGSSWVWAILGGLAVGGAAFLVNEERSRIARAITRAAPRRRRRAVAYA